MSDRLISTVNSLLENHVLHYSCIDSGDLKSFSAIGCLPVSIKVHISGDVEFLSSLVWIVMTCLHSGGYTTIPSGAPYTIDQYWHQKWGRHFVDISGLRKHIGAVIDLAEEKEGESFNEEKGRNKEKEGERRALVQQLKACYERLKNVSKSAE